MAHRIDYTKSNFSHFKLGEIVQQHAKNDSIAALQTRLDAAGLDIDLSSVHQVKASAVFQEAMAKLLEHPVSEMTLDQIKFLTNLVTETASKLKPNKDAINDWETIDLSYYKIKNAELKVRKTDFGREIDISVDSCFRIHDLNKASQLEYGRDVVSPGEVSLLMDRLSTLIKHNRTSLKLQFTIPIVVNDGELILNNTRTEVLHLLDKAGLKAIPDNLAPLVAISHALYRLAKGFLADDGKSLEDLEIGSPIDTGNLFGFEKVRLDTVVLDCSFRWGVRYARK